MVLVVGLGTHLWMLSDPPNRNGDPSSSFFQTLFCVYDDGIIDPPSVPETPVRVLCSTERGMHQAFVSLGFFTFVLLLLSTFARRFLIQSFAVLPALEAFEEYREIEILFQHHPPLPGSATLVSRVGRAAHTSFSFVMPVLTFFFQAAAIAFGIVVFVIRLFLPTASTVTKTEGVSAAPTTGGAVDDTIQYHLILAPPKDMDVFAFAGLVSREFYHWKVKNLALNAVAMMPGAAASPAFAVVK